MELSEETKLELTNQFQAYADDNGISMDDPEDWGPWWDCFRSGYVFAVQKLTGPIK